MALLSIALTTILQNEGKYSNDLDDLGKETYCGISRKNWPNWTGWTTIDILRKSSDFPAALDTSTLLQLDVQSFYKDNFWTFDGITDQGVATKIFDMCVNMGTRAALGVVQRSLSGRWGFAVNQDCKYGALTEAFIARAHPPDLLNELRAQSALHYFGIVGERPTQQKFLLGWMRRAVQ